LFWLIAHGGGALDAMAISLEKSSRRRIHRQRKMEFLIKIHDPARYPYSLVR
jgi:hypothetical protein